MSRTEEEEKELDALEVEAAPPAAAGLMVQVVTPLHPTEDESAVKLAIGNLFPVLELTTGDGSVTGRGEGPLALARFRRRIREMRIRDTARSVLRGGLGEGTIQFSLNKQSGYARVPNFSTGGAPLGDIEVTIRAEHPEAIVQWVCELDDD